VGAVAEVGVGFRRAAGTEKRAVEDALEAVDFAVQSVPLNLKLALDEFDGSAGVGGSIVVSGGWSWQGENSEVAPLSRAVTVAVKTSPSIGGASRSVIPKGAGPDPSAVRNSLPR
jgi:hypothetical protein